MHPVHDIEAPGCVTTHRLESFVVRHDAPYLLGLSLSPRRVEVRILAHLALHLFAFLFEIHQLTSAAEVAAFDLALRAAEQAA